MTTNLRSHSALGCSCVQGILLMTGGKPRFPAVPPYMVNKGNGKELSRSHTTQSDQAPRTNAFVSSLEAIPVDDWCRTWATDRTMMLRRTSKRVKEQVDKMLLPTVVRLRTTFWGCKRNITNERIMNELISMVSTCRLTTLVFDFTMWEKRGDCQM
jgi:hypothetical protein